LGWWIEDATEVTMQFGLGQLDQQWTMPVIQLGSTQPFDSAGRQPIEATPIFMVFLTRQLAEKIAEQALTFTFASVQFLG